MNDTMTAPEPAAQTPKTTGNAPQTTQFTPSDAPVRKPQYDPDYAIYKPNGRGTGGVVRLSLSRAKSCVFVDAANQCGERQFDWESKITMKWAVPDLGAILATLQGRLPEAKLFHRTDKANTALNLTRQDNPDRAPYLLAISRQDAIDSSVRKIIVPATHSEAAVLETILRAAITRILGW